MLFFAYTRHKLNGFSNRRFPTAFAPPLTRVNDGAELAMKIVRFGFYPIPFKARADETVAPRFPIGLPKF